MTQEISFAIQIGTSFDGGQQMIWTLMAEDALARANVHVPRPRAYRKRLAHLARHFDGTAAPAHELDKMFRLDQKDNQPDAHFVLKLTELMQPVPYFWRDGVWFAEIGKRAAAFRGVLAPHDVTFMISLRNPAQMLSQAHASGVYPGLQDQAPDPFALEWADILSDVRKHCPDTPIVAWTSETAPQVWRRVLESATRSRVDLSVASEIAAARGLMDEDDAARLDAYLTNNNALPERLRARVISIFLKRFGQKGAQDDEMTIPGWSDALQEQMDAHYAADIEDVRRTEGVTLITDDDPGLAQPVASGMR